MIITCLAVDAGQSDDDAGDGVVCSEVDCPPRKWRGVVGARVRSGVVVNGQTSRQLVTDLNRRLASRQTVCSTRTQSGKIAFAVRSRRE